MPGSFAMIAATLSMEEVPEHGSEKDRAAVERGFQLFSVLAPSGGNLVALRTLTSKSNRCDARGRNHPRVDCLQMGGADLAGTAESAPRDRPCRRPPRGIPRCHGRSDPCQIRPIHTGPKPGKPV